MHQGFGALAVQGFERVDCAWRSRGVVLLFRGLGFKSLGFRV